MTLEVVRCLLVDHLRNRGWTQQDLADITGINFRQVSFYATNERMMSLKNAVIISDVLNVNVRDLYEWEPVIREAKRKR